MSFTRELDRYLRSFQGALGQTHALVERLHAQLDFASQLLVNHPDQAEEWRGLILEAARLATEAAVAGKGRNEVLRLAEETLQPISAVAKQYTIHCVGHAHIDMNWMWDWPETVATVNDTFSTVIKLMQEFPEFRFSQSQASVYQIMKDYLPELEAKVKEKVASGQWEVTASQWVEGDKNLASGEILCRHLLYTKRFFQQEYGLPLDAVAIDWEPDTFGHAHTLPGILAQGGVRHYYHHRAGQGPRLYTWRGKDGSEMIVFDDRHQGYNGQMQTAFARYVLELERETGVKDYLHVFGVGDHGGGPTRALVRRAIELNSWPVFPNVVFSTTREYFEKVAATNTGLPVVDKELNFVFQGCYTAQSNIKWANRKGECFLGEAEWAALLGRSWANIPYPADDLYVGWRHIMFNQFHDILPGSGVHATYTYAQGIFQETMTRTTMAKTRAMRAVADRVKTASICGCGAVAGDGGLGYGPGDVPAVGAVSRRGDGPAGCDPYVVFNPSPWTRDEVVSVRLWDRHHGAGHVVVRDEQGVELPVQFHNQGNYWGNHFEEVSFPVKAIPAMGYRAVTVEYSPEPPQVEAPARADNGWVWDKADHDTPGFVIENEYLKLQMEPGSGAIISLVEKASGREFVPCGQKLGALELSQENVHGMTSWVIGQIIERQVIQTGATLQLINSGPWRSTIRVTNTLGKESRYTLDVTLNAGSPVVDFTLNVFWIERGSPETGVPMLRALFPVAVTDGRATFEAPMGSVERPTDGKEVPTQRWMDLSDAEAGATLVNDCKYGCSVDRNLMALTLLRSSYDPDPLPEPGQHVIRFGLRPHTGAWSINQSVRLGYDFNLPVTPVNTGCHDGELPASQAWLELLSDGVMLSGVKAAEDGEGVIVRLYETEGKPVRAQVRLPLACCCASASLVDVLEQPVEGGNVSLEQGVLQVDIPANSFVNVRVIGSGC